MGDWDSLMESTLDPEGMCRCALEGLQTNMVHDGGQDLLCFKEIKRQVICILVSWPLLFHECLYNMSVWLEIKGKRVGEMQRMSK